MGMKFTVIIEGANSTEGNFTMEDWREFGIAWPAGQTAMDYAVYLMARMFYAVSKDQVAVRGSNV